MRRVIFLILVFLSVVVLVIRFSYQPLSALLGGKARAGVRIDASIPATVSIDQKEVGKTPLQLEDMVAGDHLIEVKSPVASPSAVAPWQGYVRLNKGTLTVVNRELGNTKENSSGEVITLEEGRGASIVSQPEGSEVEIDGKAYGKTPLLISELSPGEHLFFISHSNFLKRSVRANLVNGYKLNLSVDLAISEPDLTKISTQPIQSSSSLTVLSTPTGFLRVRSSASTNASEVAQVKPGETLTLLEEIPNWDRVRLQDGKEGYVSSSYVQKKN